MNKALFVFIVVFSLFFAGCANQSSQPQTKIEGSAVQGNSNNYYAIAEKVKTLGAAKNWTKLTYDDMVKNSPDIVNNGLSTDTFAFTSSSTYEFVSFKIFSSKANADKYETLVQESKNSNPNSKFDNDVRCSDSAIITYRLNYNSDTKSSQNFDQEISGFCNGGNFLTNTEQIASELRSLRPNTQWTKIEGDFTTPENAVYKTDSAVYNSSLGTLAVMHFKNAQDATFDKVAWGAESKMTYGAVKVYVREPVGPVHTQCSDTLWLQFMGLPEGFTTEEFGKNNTPPAYLLSDSIREIVNKSVEICKRVRIEG